MNLYPHQVANTRKLVTSIRDCGSGIDASDTGTGKSITALAVARVLGKRPFVICPKSVGPGWEDKAAMAGVDGLEWLNYEMARKKLDKLNRDQLVVFDESHRISAPDTLQSKLAKRIKDAGFQTLQLSATPFATPLKTRAALHLTNRVPWDRWYGALTHLGCRRANWIPGKPWRWREKEDDIETLREMLRDSMVATKWHEVEGFPEYAVDCVPVQVPAAQRKVAEALRDRLTDNPLSDTVVERTELEALRVDPMLELAKDAMASGSSVCAFFNFTEPLRDFARAIGCDFIDGSVGGEQRETVRKAFQSSRKPTCIALNSQAGGEGLDLHDLVGVPRVSLISPPYSATLLRQIFGRTHRIGGRSRAVLKPVFIAGTIEQTRIMPRVQSRMKNIETLTDTDLL